jgi:hypothetical protein
MLCNKNLYRKVRLKSDFYPHEQIYHFTGRPNFNPSFNVFNSFQTSLQNVCDNSCAE